MTQNAERPLIGVVGLGLMGRSIATCLLASGHPVAGVTDDIANSEEIRQRIKELLEEMQREGLLKGNPGEILGRVTVSDRVDSLSGAELVVESVTEDLDLKRRLLREVEAVVSPDCILASNTSALPISLLQAGFTRPQRVMGIHWAEPAHVTTFLEIIPGPQTEQKYMERAAGWAKLWGKEPSIMRREIRGFITNRIAYAMFREACHLVESGVCTMEDVDRSLRNDVGWWIPFAGPFRYMDLTGVDAYRRVMVDLLPDLCNDTSVPKIVEDVVRNGGRGISTGRGFYQYTKEEAEEWERRFLEFNYRIRKLLAEYSDLRK
jgi:3-hydroxybutyryl-CoA dehydrogenase